MATNIFARYIWLIDQLRRFKRLNLKELNVLWQKSLLWNGREISERTFFNHRNAIEEIFDIDIRCDVKDLYRYYIADLEYLEKDSLRCWLLNSFATFHQIKADKSLRSRIRYEEIPSGHHHLTDLIEAMRMNYAVRIHYQGFKHETMREILLNPYCLCIYARRWYVIGYSGQYPQPRTFALDRINKMEMTQTPFSLPDGWSMERYFEGSCGIIVNEDTPVQRVELKVYENARDYVSTLPLHTSQRETAHDAHSTTYEYHVRIDFNFIQRVLEQADLCEVLEPASLRNQLKHIAEHLNRYYE